MTIRFNTGGKLIGGNDEIDPCPGRTIERLRSVIQFARDKCVCRNAGGNTAFAYLWKDDWDEFERMAEDSKEGATEC